MLKWSRLCEQETNADKQGAVAKVLGIPDAEADSLRQVISAGDWKLGEDAEDESSFF